MCHRQPQCPRSRGDSELAIASATGKKRRETTRERENCAHVRTLLALKQPEFALAVALAEQELTHQDGCLPDTAADGSARPGKPRAIARLPARRALAPGVAGALSPSACGR